MKLTIITINRNNSEGLRKTIESVISQTYTDFEYIIIDGASTDGSVEVIKEYADRFTYWVSEPDTGIYNAMNKGILKAKGEYCFFLNSGDKLQCNDITYRISYHLKNYDIVTGNILVSNKIIISPDELSVRNLLISNISHQAIFYKRDLFTNLGLYDESFKILSDFDFNLLCAVNMVSYSHINEILVNYDEYGISSSQENEKIMREEGQTIIFRYMNEVVYNDIRKMLNKKEDFHPAIRWIIKNKILFKLLKAIYLIFGNKQKSVYE